MTFLENQWNLQNQIAIKENPKFALKDVYFSTNRGRKANRILYRYKFYYSIFKRNYTTWALWITEYINNQLSQLWGVNFVQ